MVLVKRREWFEDEYRCDITYFLDEILKLKEHHVYDGYYNYILWDNSDNLHAIRVPGRTVGEIEVDENMCIARVFISEYCYTSYGEDVNEKLERFVGQKLEF